jgi:N6-adenosine-specific RNA methylase IME4
MTRRGPTQWTIADIRIGKRHRRDMGDLELLAASIERDCLLQPLAITPEGTLIAGERRLRACQKLGWETVPVHVVDIDAVVRGELAENTLRKNFTPTEMVAIADTVERRERELAKERMRLGKFSPGSDTGRTRDKVAAPLGISGRTLEKARQVINAAKFDPKTFGPLVDEMDRSGKVHAAHRELKRLEDEKRIPNLKTVEGRFRALVIDPPWPYELDFIGRGKPTYAIMTMDELRALPVASWADENAHLYLWVTNAMVPHAVELTTAWGFRHNTMLTWIKPRFGMGSHFRNQSEHVIFAIRGRLRTRANGISTTFEAPVGKHSEKPEKFYDIVRAASYPPYGEAFQRRARRDFKNLYIEKIAEAAE